jgi:general stress protein CsbA
MKPILASAGIAGLLIFLGWVIVFGPFVTIWALNTLFPSLAIPYTFNTWIAVIWIVSITSGNASVKRKF